MGSSSIQKTLPYTRPVSPACAFEDQISELTEKLQNEQFLKQTYEETLKSLRDRLTQIERRIGEKSKEHERILEEQRLAFDMREKMLLERIDQMEKVNRELLTTVNNETRPSITRQIQNLTTEFNTYKKAAEIIPKIEKELQELTAQCSYHRSNSSLDNLSENTRKLSNLPHKLQKTIQKFPVKSRPSKISTKSPQKKTLSKSRKPT